MSLISLCRWTISFSILILSVFVTSVSSPALENTPESLVRAFFSKNGIDNKPAVYTGELLELRTTQPTLGQLLRETVTIKVRPLKTKRADAVYAVEVDNSGSGADWYVFLREESGIWKLEAVRALSLTGPIEAEVKRLNPLRSRSAEAERLYQHYALTIARDTQLKDYVRTHVAQLEELAQLARAGKHAEATMIAKERSLLHVENLPENTAIVQIAVGGILDNTVGFMCVPPGMKVPDMSPSDYIYIEHVIGSWYVYKTT
jgi:hypothetical protein